MKRFRFKALCFLLAGALCLSALTGCKSGEDIEIDATRTQLYVHSYNGGVGIEWLNDIAKQFESDYKDVNFEPNKTGVQVIVSGSKNDVENTMSTGNNAVYFEESVNYSSLVSQGKLLDITDVVQSSLNDLKSGAENSTIESKMAQGVKDGLTFREGKYYAVPHYTVFANITYNKKLFVNEKLYFKDGVTGSFSDESQYFIKADTDTKSCGPDGIKGTDDDGLPATWDEFKILCDYMVKRKDIDPFIWSLANANYVNYLLNAVYMNLAGKDQASLQFTFDSGKQFEKIDSFTGNNPNTSVTTITESNASDLNRQLTKYQTLKVAEWIYKTQKDGKKVYCYPTKKSGELTMLQTQQEYVLSATDKSMKPIAFLAEGSYWYNEADEAGYIDEAKSNPDYASKNEYAVMPLPHFYSGLAKDVENDAPVGGFKSVIADQSDAFAFIGANIADDANLVNLAKTFLKYCYTDSALKAFTEKTGVPRNLTYDADETELPSDYAKSVWKTHKNSDNVITMSGKAEYLNNRLKYSYILTSKVWLNNSGKLFTVAMNSDDTAENFFKDMWNKQ